MLTRMDGARRLVREARRSARLSTRALAARAQVSPSTISRIEGGRIDPTVGMLSKILLAAGRSLHLETSPASPVLADLAHAWTVSPDGARPDWTRFRIFLDDLALHPDRTAEAITLPPSGTGSSVIDALLAGIAEKLADDAGLTRPAWATSVPPAEELWQSPGTPKMRAAALSATPPQLLARNVVVTRATLWRDPLPTGA